MPSPYRPSRLSFDLVASEVANKIRTTPNVWVSSETLCALARLRNNDLLEQVVAYLGPRLALVPIAGDNLDIDRRSNHPAVRATAQRVCAALSKVPPRERLVAPELEMMAHRAVKNVLDQWEELKGSSYQREIAEQFAAVWYGDTTSIAIGQANSLVQTLNGKQGTARYGPRVFGAHHLLAVACLDNHWDACKTWAVVRYLHFEAKPPNLRLKIFGGLPTLTGETERSALAFMEHGYEDLEF